MSKTSYKGINYDAPGSNSNKDVTTGIRYGVIPQNDVLQSWADSSEAQYAYHCPYCGSGPLKRGYEAKRCPDCYKKIKESDWDIIEPVFYTYEQDGYVCESDSYGDIFVCKSPYYTYAQFCSPCAPGAGDLNSELEDKIPDNKAYCFGHDWFEDGKAPYTVYSVETNEVVLPEGE